MNPGAFVAGKAPTSMRLPHPAWLLPILALAACQPSPRSDSGDAPDTTARGIAVLDVAPPVYQPKAAEASDGEAAMCAQWSLDKSQAEAFFALSEPLAEGGLHDFGWLPCSISGRLQAGGREWTFEINAAGTSTWRSADETRLLGCAREACEPFVILMPEHLQD